MAGVFRSSLYVLLLSFSQLALDIPAATASPAALVSTNAASSSKGSPANSLEFASPVTMAWNPSPDSNVVGYFLCWGLASGQCTNRLNVGNATSGMLAGLLSSALYYIVVIAYDGAGRESPPSNEVTYSTTATPLSPAIPDLTMQTNSAPCFQSVRRSAGALTLTWRAVPGESYQVQYKRDLIQTNWVNLGNPIKAADTNLTASDPISPDPQRFYRIILVPQ
jgi:hypothetical protein